MHDEADRAIDTAREPSLVEMTKTSIRVPQKGRELDESLGWHRVHRH